MPKFTVEVRDRAVIDIMATVEVEAENPEAAIALLENAEFGTGPMADVEFEPEVGLGWYDSFDEWFYKVYDEDGDRVDLSCG